MSGFLPLDLVQRLDAGRNGGIAVATSADQRHPTIAIWPVNSRAAIADALQQRRLSVNALTKQLNAVAVPAHADPGDVIDPGANYPVFLQAIAQDGIVMDGQQAIREGIAVCTLIHPPNDGSLWDAGQFLLSTHPDWRIESALSFARRAIQDICPHRGSF